ncbi:helix-turn-helix domain-containing protein [Acidobacteria bacterium AH-259-D05]|nr:helix-turn-helix domain-containing protein [Acidobacteria bacterium AH-259-D05]
MQNIRIELGQRVRDLRKSNGWSQETLGEKADLHPTYVGGIERGERNVSLENLQRLAQAFHISLAELFNFPKTRQTKKDTLKAQISGLLYGRSQADLEFILTVITAFDSCKKQGKT